jgi:hypothetical protein
MVKRLVADGVAQPDRILRMNDDRQEHMVEVELDG